ncbi:MAG: site-specific integrase [Ruminococcaceae bacterium]|nr:site-specific integrase [Oscillospiraceae bacterium]
MATKKLLTNGNAFKRTDGRWGGTVWYMDESGERKRKSFSGTTKQAVNKKMTAYIENFNNEIEASVEANKTLKESMTNWLRVFKFPSVERTTYDRYECTAENQIYPLIGNKIVGNITAADIKKVLNHWMNEGYAYTTVKKVHIILGDYFKHLTQEELITRNPMNAAPMIKKSNFYAIQEKEDLPTNETVTVFTAEEIKRLKTEANKQYKTGKKPYRQAGAYILMLNTGLRAGEMLGVLNSDIDLERRVLHVQRGVKVVNKRDGVERSDSSTEVKVGKLKSNTSKRDIPLNDTAIKMIQELRQEYYFGEDSPLICDEKGDYTKPDVFRRRYHRLLEGAGIESKGLHSLRHTFATNLVNGVKQPDGTVKALTVKQVADLLGHSTTQVTEIYYVKKDTSMLNGITNDFCL